MFYSAVLCSDVCRCLWCVASISCIEEFTSISVGGLDVPSFADRLWGDIYFNPGTRKFTRKPADVEQDRSFVHFILNPLYKIYSHVLSEETEDLKETLGSLGIELTPVIYKMDVRPLLKVVLDNFFGPATGLIDIIAEHIPNPIDGAKSKVDIPQSLASSSHLPL